MRLHGTLGNFSSIGLGVALLFSICAAASNRSAQAENGLSIDSLIAKPSMNIVISTSDSDKVKEFYGGALGLKPMSPLMLPGNREMTRFLVGTSEIKFLVAPKDAPSQTGAIQDANGIRLLTFIFPDYDELEARFKAHGIEMPALQTVEGTSVRYGFLPDPDGNIIEVAIVPDAPKETYDSIAIGMTVADAEKTRAFYGEFLKLEELEPEFIESLGVNKYSFRHGTTTIKFWAPKGERPTHSGRWQDALGLRYIQYIVSDLDAVDAHARAEGADIHTPIFDLGGMARIMFIADPDGVINEFVGGPKPK